MVLYIYIYFFHNSHKNQKSRLQTGILWYLSTAHIAKPWISSPVLWSCVFKAVRCSGLAFSAENCPCHLNLFVCFKNHLGEKIYLSLRSLISVCVCVLSCSVVSDSATPWTVAHQAPLSMGILQASILEWVAMPFSRGSSRPRDQTQVSRIAGRFFTDWATREGQEHWG